MKKILVCLGLLLPLLLPAQDVDYDVIQTEIGDPESLYYYPALLKRYQENDTNLSLLDYRHLYYGWPFQAAYEPYKIPDNQEKYGKMIRKEKWGKLIKLAKSRLKENPFDLHALLDLAVALKQSGKDEEGLIYTQKWVSIARNITRSGNGDSCEEGFDVIRVQDEYFYMRINQWSHKSQAFVDGICDSFSLKDSERMAVYFDVSIAIWHQAGEFDKRKGQ